MSDNTKPTDSSETVKPSESQSPQPDKLDWLTLRWYRVVMILIGLICLTLGVNMRGFIANLLGIAFYALLAVAIFLPKSLKLIPPSKLPSVISLLDRAVGLIAKIPLMKTLVDPEPDIRKKKKKTYWKMPSVEYYNGTILFCRRDVWLAYVLWFAGGFLGIHRIYMGDREGARISQMLLLLSAVWAVCVLLYLSAALGSRDGDVLFFFGIFGVLLPCVGLVLWLLKDLWLIPTTLKTKADQKVEAYLAENDVDSYGSKLTQVNEGVIVNRSISTVQSEPQFDPNAASALTVLAELLEMGAISEHEFEKEKGIIMSGANA